MTFASRAAHAKLARLRLSLALLESSFSLNDLLSHLFVEIVLILIYLIRKVLLGRLDLLAELLDILGRLSILYNLADRPHHIDDILVAIFPKLGEDWDARRLFTDRAG